MSNKELENIDLRPLEYKHPGCAAKIVGDIVELTPECYLRPDERKALHDRMAAYVLELEKKKEEE